jgi:hypothetical protein
MQSEPTLNSSANKTANDDMAKREETLKLLNTIFEAQKIILRSIYPTPKGDEDYQHAVGKLYMSLFQIF